MSVNFSFAIGYGIVISQEEFEAIENIIEDVQASLKAKKMANAKIMESKSLKGEL